MKFSGHALRLKDVLPSALGVVVLGLALCLTAPPGWSVMGGLGWWSLPAGVVLGGVLYLLGYIFTRVPSFYAGSMRDLIQMLHNLFRNFSWFDIILVSCLAGLGEELLIRGVLQAWLVDYSTPLAGILLASFIFGLMHALSKAYVVLTAVLGCFFGVALYLSHSIILVIVAHAVYDILAFFIIVKRPHWLGVYLQDKQLKLPIHEQY